MTCVVTPQTLRSDVTVGRNACCRNASQDSNLALSFWSFLPEVTSCVDAPRMCRTMLMLYADKGDSQEVYYLNVDEVELVIEDVEKLSLHYQVCGVDELRFILPLSCKCSAPIKHIMTSYT